MPNYQLYMTKEREFLLKQLRTLPNIDPLTRTSDLLEMGLESLLEKQEKHQNTEEQPLFFYDIRDIQNYLQKIKHDHTKKEEFKQKLLQWDREFCKL